MSADHAAFGAGDNNEMSILGLFTKVIGLVPSVPRDEIFDTCEVATRRLCREKLTVPSATKIKFVDSVMRFAPHLCIRPLKDVLPVSRSSVGGIRLCVVIDTSGSMRDTIRVIQAMVKKWIDEHMSLYTDLTIIIFDDKTHVFHTTECLNTVHGAGRTYAKPALTALRAALGAKGDCIAHTIIVTDGVFDEGMDAYNIKELPNIAAFLLLFPTHTPENAENEHYTYLPRITPAGIPIVSQRLRTNESLPAVCDVALKDSYLPPIETTVYNVIGGEYAMLANMEVSQMIKMLDIVLAYPERTITHTFLSHIMGIFNVMMNRSGDLSNTLRSPEMRAMWGFLQPLKRRLSRVSPSDQHFTTVSIVLDFLKEYEASVIDKRDKRLAELRMMQRTQKVIDEIAEFKRIFEDMKKMDDGDRILVENAALKAEGHPVIHVKFNHLASVACDAFKMYPNVKMSDAVEIFKMIASIGITSPRDPDAIEMVIDPNSRGLIDVLRLMTYRKTDTTRMTLTSLVVVRILLGFYANQMIDSKYEFTSDHARIHMMIAKFVSTMRIPTFWTYMTDTDDAVNCSPEWLRVLCKIAKNVDVRFPKEAAPANTALWRVMPESVVLNKHLLDLMVSRNTALALIRFLSTPSSRQELTVDVTHTHFVRTPDFTKIISVQARDSHTWQAWRDEVVDTIYLENTKVTIEVTRGMLLQERIVQNVNTFLEKYWEIGHRFIGHTVARPVAALGGTRDERDAMDEWVREAWNDYKTIYPEMELSTTYPSVSEPEMKVSVNNWLRARASNHPICFRRLVTTEIPLCDVVRKCPVSSDVVEIALHLCAISGFTNMSSDEQAGLAKTVVPTYEDVFEDPIAQPREIEEAITRFIPKVSAHFSSMQKVTGVGRRMATRIKTVVEWDNLGESLRMAEGVKKPVFPDEDFYCPLLGEIFVDPVSFGGHYYERSGIESWLSFDTRRSSPLTRSTHDAEGRPLQILPVMSSIFLSELADFKRRNGVGTL